MMKRQLGSGLHQPYLAMLLEAGHTEGGKNQKDESDCQTHYDSHIPPPP